MKLLPSLLKNTTQPRTINSAYVDATLEPPPQSLCAKSDTEEGDPIETVIRGLRSDRLFFEPGESSSILEAKAPAAATSSLSLKDSVLLSMESGDPYLDFRKSMEEMVEAHGVKDWENLEELLCWYLRVNAKTNHRYILAAFVDFLFASETNSVSNSHSPYSPLSFYTSSSPSSSFSTPCASSTLEAEQLEADHNDTPTSSLSLNHQIRHPEDEASSSTSTSTL
ncbi:transcription repressor OFP15-like [Senna tora]|uniref:Transcription repressor n=1 Tax=Senna tora TaxID=362788 RepID=A0A834SIM9_9FABA|nr:transcription repressor OFP15-like [Senna tora]